jgi:acetyl esterase/lipase
MPMYISLMSRTDFPDTQVRDSSNQTTRDFSQTDTLDNTALMVHGGGHSMLSRKDIRPKQTALLLANGFLPVSIDYRLCPEVNILDGAMTDVCDALAWAREKLTHIGSSMGVQVNGGKVAVIGWSTGGTLSLQLGFAARNRGIKAPDATLAFYCPSNYEDECESDWFNWSYSVEGKSTNSR